MRRHARIHVGGGTVELKRDCGPRARRRIGAAIAVLLLGASLAAGQPSNAGQPERVGADPSAALQPGPGATTAPTQAGAATPTDAADASPRFMISKFEIVAPWKNDAISNAEGIALSAPVELKAGADGALVASGPGAAQRFTLAEAPSGQYSRDAINAICAAIVARFNEAGIATVFVVPDPMQIVEAEGYRDGRPAGTTTITLQVYVGAVTDVRTIASGDRIPESRKLNAAEHERIRVNSPVLGSPDGTPGKGGIVRTEVLDDYVFQLNRHPGRRVDVAVAASDVEGGVTLDYLVAESRPYYAYFQISNTGTRNTNEWRERFGFVHNQFTGRDDILSLDYTTAGFEDTHSVSASYDFPILDSYKLRARIYGTWGTFTASDVGFIDQSFKGNELLFGAEATLNVWQQREAFVDVFAGVRWQDVAVSTDVAGVGAGEGSAQFWQPSIGLRFTRSTEPASTSAQLELVYGTAGNSQAQLDGLRFNADSQFWLLRGGFEQTMFLEPLFNRGAFEQGKLASMAHEISLSLRGQVTLGDERLVPQIEETVGGLYSVRGYRESVAAGDSVFIGSLEYRYHVPRAFKVQPEPGKLFGQPFRYAPAQPYGRPDWDLIIRPFVDVGYVANSNRLAIERDNLLVGVGIGLELQFKQSVSFRADYGIALTDVEGNGFDEVTAGSSRFHFMFTFLY